MPIEEVVCCNGDGVDCCASIVGEWSVCREVQSGLDSYSGKGASL